MTAGQRQLAGPRPAAAAPILALTMAAGAWWPLGGVSLAKPEQLDDLETILNEAQAVIHHTRTEDAGEADSEAAGAAATSSARVGAGAGLPVSHGSRFPSGSKSSPQKHASPSEQAPAQARAVVPPSAAAWLPSRCDEHTAAAAQPAAGWRAYVPAALAWSVVGSSSATERPHASPPPPPPLVPGRPGAAPCTWAEHAQQQWAAACRATTQLAATGGSTAGTVALGAALGGAVAGPLGLAVGAKSGAALVAAGAVSGAAVKRYVLSPSKRAAQREGSEERELLPVIPQAATTPGTPSGSVPARTAAPM